MPQCKYCKLWYNPSDPEWIRWEGPRDNGFCSQDCEHKDEYYQNKEYYDKYCNDEEED
jgi:hypothetical protein